MQEALGGALQGADGGSNNYVNLITGFYLENHRKNASEVRLHHYLACCFTIMPLATLQYCSVPVSTPSFQVRSWPCSLANPIFSSRDLPCQSDSPGCGVLFSCLVHPEQCSTGTPCVLMSITECQESGSWLLSATCMIGIGCTFSVLLHTKERRSASATCMICNGHQLHHLWVA